MKLKLLTFLKQTISAINYMFLTNIFREKEVSDQTTGTSLQIAGFVESFIRNKLTYQIPII